MSSVRHEQVMELTSISYEKLRFVQSPPTECTRYQRDSLFAPMKHDVCLLSVWLSPFPQSQKDLRQTLASHNRVVIRIFYTSVDSASPH